MAWVGVRNGQRFLVPDRPVELEDFKHSGRIWQRAPAHIPEPKGVIPFPDDEPAKPRRRRRKESDG